MTDIGGQYVPKLTLARTKDRDIPKPPRRGLDAQSIIDAFASRMMYSVVRDGYNATELDAFNALAWAVRDRLTERWFTTQNAYYERDAKRVYYLSLEFLLGRLLLSSIVNLGAVPQYVEAMQKLGFSLEELGVRESDAGLGNGGLGRLAACFIDAAATLSIPFDGYGIRYEYGIFRQRFIDGAQVEYPDPWLRYGNPWEVPRPDVVVPVRFQGRSEYYVDSDGVGRFRWVDSRDVYAMAYDLAVPGYGNNTVNSLRLWAAKSSREFDLEKFNAGAYVEAVEDKTRSENISKVLYPADNQTAGRELRLRQQYFFVSATVQDIIRRFKKRSTRVWSELPSKVAVQLNDTHPSIAIPELMRVLLDEELLGWEEAWDLCQAVFGYTNHTVLPEALETWPLDLMRYLLPRHLQIIEEIDRRFRASAYEIFEHDDARVSRLAPIEYQTGRVRMANLAIVGSHSVNGVARLHTEILKNELFADFNAMYPGKFNNKTNGITPRRWLVQANPELSLVITQAIGDGWPKKLEMLRDLEKFASEASFREKWSIARQTRKNRLAAWLQKTHSITIDPQSLFDVQIKRMHEYKRQLLNVMHVIALHHRIVAGDTTIVPRTVIFGGKSAPGYFMAKLIIRLVNRTAELVKSDDRSAKLLNVVFVPNYDVSSAELLFPATDLSEQISTAGTEASGTGCMKAVLNGGVIIGTHDGATIEIAEEVGEENILLFGHKTDEIRALQASGYRPHEYIDKTPELKRVIDQIASFGDYGPIVEALTGADKYFHCADFAPYLLTQRCAEEIWNDRESWMKMSIANTARSGRFSADRTIAEYAKDIWNVEPVVI